jgi:hypothetical protein
MIANVVTLQNSRKKIAAILKNANEKKKTAFGFDPIIVSPCDGGI